MAVEPRTSCSAKGGDLVMVAHSLASSVSQNITSNQGHHKTFVIMSACSPFATQRKQQFPFSLDFFWVSTLHFVLMCITSLWKCFRTSDH